MRASQESNREACDGSGERREDVPEPHVIRRCVACLVACSAIVFAPSIDARPVASVTEAVPSAGPTVSAPVTPISDSVAIPSSPSPSLASAVPEPSVAGPSPAASDAPFPGEIINVAPTVAPPPTRVLLHAMPIPARPNTPAPARTLLHALPVNAPLPVASEDASSQPMQPDSQPADYAYALLGARWTCRTDAGTPIFHRFHRDDDGRSIDVDTTASVRGRKILLTERYRYHVTTKRWSVSLAGGKFIATATRWTGANWTFHGIDSEVDEASEATMMYKKIDPYTFMRTFSLGQGASRKVYSSEKCLRVDA